MSNMSYCQFENTLSDLIQCNITCSEHFDFESIEEDMSKFEKASFHKMYKECQAFIEYYERMKENS